MITRGEKKTVINVGVVGLGARGISLLRMLLNMPDVQISYVCDLYEDRVKAGLNAVERKKSYIPTGTLDYKTILNDNNVDAVMIFVGWESHVRIAVEAMLAGKYVGMEVGGAYSLEDCWNLVDTYEKTNVPIMMLENCCYGKYELMVLNMVNQGILGDVVHCSGGYCHDLRKEIAFGKENRHYRLQEYLNRNCENYPTHELGPIAKILKINRGNLMVLLTSCSSVAKGMNAYLNETPGVDPKLINAEFKQGDIITTVIKCALGETIVLTLDTTLPRHYSRGFTIRGTKGMYQEEGNIMFLDKRHNRFDFLPKFLWNNGKRYFSKYKDDIWKWYRKVGVRGGHGGMDYLVLRAFIESCLNGIDTPIDVYDAASWMCITPLSELSIANNGKTVDIPDFTRGKWSLRNPQPTGRFFIT